jgi:Mn-dependent DtxR family transcriptional regulator
MKMQESPEDYMEAILVLSKELGNVRSIDVANYLGYSKPSISVAMKRLRENGFVSTDDHGNLMLTGSGLAIALKIYERHIVLSQFLISIGVDEETAKKDACRMEHVISDVSFEKIKQLPRN